jgi:hypothetical protein
MNIFLRISLILFIANSYHNCLSIEKLYFAIYYLIGAKDDLKAVRKHFSIRADDNDDDNDLTVNHVRSIHDAVAHNIFQDKLPRDKNSPSWGPRRSLKSYIDESFNEFYELLKGLHSFEHKLFKPTEHEITELNKNGDLKTTNIEAEQTAIVLQSNIEECGSYNTDTKFYYIMKADFPETAPPPYETIEQKKQKTASLTSLSSSSSEDTDSDFTHRHAKNPSNCKPKFFTRIKERLFK